MWTKRNKVKSRERESNSSQKRHRTEPIISEKRGEKQQPNIALLFWDESYLNSICSMDSLIYPLNLVGWLAGWLLLLQACRSYVCLNTSYIGDERIRILRVFSFYRNANRRACARRISTCRPRVAVLVSLHVGAFHHYSINCRHISEGIHSAAPLISTAHPRLDLFLPWSLSTVFLDPTIPWMSYYLLHRARTIIRCS